MNAQSSIRILGTMAAAIAIACNKSSEGARVTDSAAGTAAKTSTPTTPSADSGNKVSSAGVPKTVDAVGSYAEDLYDEAKAGNWRKAARLLDSLRAGIAQLPAEVPADAKKSLSATADSLQREIGAKDRNKAMIDANRATYVSAELVRNYSGPTPGQVLLLDYEGRELEIWAAMKNADKLATTKADIRRFWNELRRFVVARNPAQAQHTDALIARIEKANTPAELGLLASPFLDEVDLLEKVFTNQ
jgi:hypothetical protein